MFVGWQAKRAARDNAGPEVDAGSKLRVNEQITAPIVRLVFADGGHQARCPPALHARPSRSSCHSADKGEFVPNIGSQLRIMYETFARVFN